jgi:hypothetical protein
MKMDIVLRIREKSDYLKRIFPNIPEPQGPKYVLETSAGRIKPRYTYGFYGHPLTDDIHYYVERWVLDERNDGNGIVKSTQKCGCNNGVGTSYNLPFMEDVTLRCHHHNGASSCIFQALCIDGIKEDQISEGLLKQAAKQIETFIIKFEEYDTRLLK